MQKSDINTHLVSLHNIVKDNFFKIPDYQRGYSWEKKQLEDLRKDIENIASKNYKHYTGTIVAIQKKDNLFEIVDGQQRLTTFFILLNEALKYSEEKFEFLAPLFILRGKAGNKQPVLETNEETRVYFNNAILQNENYQPKVKSHFRLRDAQVFFRKWFQEKNVDVQKIVDIVTNQLGFIFFTPNDSKEIGIMFEVINNRGKSLSELEKIKNYFIYYASIHDYPSFRDNINDKWGDIQINLSRASILTNEEENRFLTNCYRVFFDCHKSKSQHVYDELKEKFPPIGKSEDQQKEDLEKLEKFVEFLRTASINYAYLFNQNFFKETYSGNEKEAVYQVLKRIRCHPIKASILPLYLSAMSYLVSDTERVVQLLHVLEILNFRVYLLPKVTSRADSKQAHLFWIAHELYNDRNWHTSQEDEPFISSFRGVKIDGDNLHWAHIELVDFTMQYCSERKLIQSLTIDEDEVEDYYHWKGLRFFLASFEEYKQLQNQKTFDIQEVLKKRADVGVKNNDFLSLEHIWAREDKKKFDKNHLEKRRLGNFVLLGLSKNIQLSNSDIADKIDELLNKNNKKGYGHNSLIQIADLPIILKQAESLLREKVKDYKRRGKNYYRDLSTLINDDRETELIHFALERWMLPEENFVRFIKVDSFEMIKENEKFILKEDLSNERLDRTTFTIRKHSE